MTWSGLATEWCPSAGAGAVDCNLFPRGGDRGFSFWAGKVWAHACIHPWLLWAPSGQTWWKAVLTSETSPSTQDSALLLAVLCGGTEFFRSSHFWSFSGFILGLQLLFPVPLGIWVGFFPIPLVWTSPLLIFPVFCLYRWRFSLSYHLILFPPSPPIGFILAAASFLVTGFCANPFLTLSISRALPSPISLTRVSLLLGSSHS